MSATVTCARAQLADDELRQRRLVAERLVERPREPGRSSVDVRLDDELLVLGAEALGDRAGVGALVVARRRRSRP